MPVTRKVIAMTVVLALGACSEPPDTYAGYVEGEYVRVASPVAGQLLELPVGRGENVEQGAALFALERTREGAALEEAGFRLEQAEATVAQAARQLARSRQLRADRNISREALDAAIADDERARARVREVKAAIEQARWAYEQKAPVAPATALVQDVFFRVGEWVPAGVPVVSLLPPENRLIRFFVPEPVVATLQPGQSVQVSCDACGESITATIRFVAPDAEFTPPVIYSREQRARLVFRVEARPDAARAQDLPPGLPVDVKLAP